MLSYDLIEGAEAAARFVRLNGGARAIYRMSANGHLPVIRKGRKLFYRKSDLEAAFQVLDHAGEPEITDIAAPPTIALRDWFAGQALASVADAAHRYHEGDAPQILAERAYRIADAMLAESLNGPVA